MGLIEFSKLPVNTLVGADWRTFKTVTKDQHIAPEKRTKFLLTKAICRLLSVCVPLQDRKYRKLLADKPIENDPLFIVGHWRCGTTFVHNIFAQDKHFGYTTTYQTVFPHYVMALQGLFKPTMGWLMPNKRPTDNMELAPDLPQEEEFALNNACPYNYYNFWFFPERMQEYADRYLTFRDIRPDELEEFKQAFTKLVKISLWNTGGTQYLSKNPPHTGRLKALTELFPDAKFVYLMRNPYTVFESTRSFFLNTIHPLELHSIPQEQFEQNILRNYMELYHAYKEQKQFVPKENIIEVKFEDIERNPLEMIEDIYRRLRIPGWEEARADITAYIEGKKGYRKNRYEYDPRTIELVNEHWGEVLQDWGYERQTPPANIVAEN